MIVVTGLRSGTSLVMQTLKELGVSIIGEKFHKEFPHVELNPKGYYDLPLKDTFNGVNTYKYKGKGIKISGGALLKTEPKYISKIIWCKREKKQCVESIVKLLKANYEEYKVEPEEKIATYIYCLNESFIKLYLTKSKKEYIEVDYDKIIDNPEKEITRIKEFLNLSCSITKAINNVGV